MKTKSLPTEPYFKGQTKVDCGCYYPDVTRIGDDLDRKVRLMYCIRHGSFDIPMRSDTVKHIRHSGLTTTERIVPTEQWREKERRRIAKRYGGAA